jgi:hypothetical protein
MLMDKLMPMLIRCAAGAVLGAIAGFILDQVFRSQGFWFIGLMAGMIGGAMSLYLMAEEEEPADTASLPVGHTFGIQTDRQDSPPPPTEEEP